MGIDNDSRLVFGYILGDFRKKELKLVAEKLSVSWDSDPRYITESIESIQDAVKTKWPLVELEYACPWYNCGVEDFMFYLTYYAFSRYGGITLEAVIAINTLEYEKQLNEAYTFFKPEEKENKIKPEFSSLPHIW